MTEDQLLRILLADDDDDDRILFEDAASDTGYPFRFNSVKDGNELLRTLRLQELLPHLVFLDLNMPIKNGMDCLLEIRSEELLKEINVIIYSTSANKREIDESYKNGANLYIQKPVNYSDLKSTLVKVFSMDWTNYRSKPPKEWFAWLQSMGKHDY